jgi:hypothetical protein
MSDGDVLSRVGTFLLTVLPFAVWCAWWLWCVDWRKVWPVLAGGAWAPVVLLLLVVAVAWSRVAPGPCDCLGFVSLPTFWWHLGAVVGLACAALFCGWLQGYFGWAPPEVRIEPPPSDDLVHHAHH